MRVSDAWSSPSRESHRARATSSLHGTKPRVSQIRIADVELNGTHRLNHREIDVLVHVTWYRQDESDLRQTTIRQHWRNTDGWQLAQEERADGDTGILGERTDTIPVMDAGSPARFPTIHLSGATPN